MLNYYSVVQILSGFSSEHTYPTIAYFRFFRKGKWNILNKVLYMYVATEEPHKQLWSEV